MFLRETYLPLHYKIWRDGQGVFVEQSRASLVGDHFPYSPYNLRLNQTSRSRELRE